MTGQRMADSVLDRVVRQHGAELPTTTVFLLSEDPVFRQFYLADGWFVRFYAAPTNPDVRFIAQPGDIARAKDVRPNRLAYRVEPDQVVEVPVPALVAPKPKPAKKPKPGYHRGSWMNPCRRRRPGSIGGAPAGWTLQSRRSALGGDRRRGFAARRGGSGLSRRAEHAPAAEHVRRQRDQRQQDDLRQEPLYARLDDERPQREDVHADRGPLERQPAREPGP